MITFDTLFDRIMGHEGKLTLNAHDSGNWTGGKVGKGELKGSMYGVSAASYPHLDIASLTRDQAKAIVYEDFYIALGMGRFSPAMQFQIMDAAYNHGMWNTSKIYQRAVSAKDDGIIGPMTLKAAAKMSEDDRLLRFMAARIRFWASLKSFDEFGRGWMRRAADNLDYAALDNSN